MRVIVATLCLLFAPVLVAADPILITVTSGTATLQPSTGPVTLGAIDFSLTGHLYTGNVQPAEPVLQPGSSLPFSGYWTSGDIGGSVTYNGLTSPITHQVLSFLRFDAGTLTLPPLSTSALLSAPFTFSGQFTNDTLDLLMYGSGTASFALRQNTFLNTWHLESARYDFADSVQTPEPSTLLLLGSALVVGFWRKCKANSRLL